MSKVGRDRGDSSAEALLVEVEELKAALARSEERQRSLEAEIHDLANLYIAASHLTDGLGLERTLRNLVELLSQLVGASSFVLYVPARGEEVAEAESALPCFAAGHELSEVPEVRPGEGPLGEAWRSGAVWLASETEGSVASPLAIVPLLLSLCPDGADGGAAEGEEAPRVVGLLSITAFLEQKPSWAELDRELLLLLGKNTAVALVAASLHEEAERRAEAEGARFDPRAALARLAAVGAQRSN